MRGMKVRKNLQHFSFLLNYDSQAKKKSVNTNYYPEFTGMG